MFNILCRRRSYSLSIPLVIERSVVNIINPILIPFNRDLVNAPMIFTVAS